MLKQVYIIIGLFLLVSMSIVVLPRPSGAASGEPAAVASPAAPFVGSNPTLLIAQSQAAEQRATMAQVSLKFARRGHTATALGDGRVLIVGGENQDGPLARAEILDPSSQTVKSGPNSVIPRSHHTATSLPDGRVIVIGGSGSSGPLDSTEVYDPVRNKFSVGPRLLRARVGHTATLLDDGRILVTGGRSDNTAEILAPLAGAPVLLDEAMTASRSFHSAVLMKDGNVLIAGGISSDKKALESAEICSIGTMTFAAVSKPMYIRRVRPLMRTLPDGKIQVIGGDPDGSMELYDPESKGFGAVAHLAPTADLISFAAMLGSQTRSGFIDAVDYHHESTVKHQYPESLTKPMADSSALLDRADYASAEMPESNLAVIAGGISSRGEYLKSLEILRASPAVITTSQAYYPPDVQATVIGSGWQPNETVNIVRQEARPDRQRIAFESTADAQGNLQVNGLPPASRTDSLNYTITAVGASSGYVAQTIYRGGLAQIPEPDHLDFSIPISGADASVETNAGLLTWKIRSGGNPVTAPGDVYAARHTAGNGIRTQSNDLGSATTLLPNGPCLGLDLGGGVSVQGCGEITAQFLSGNFDFSASLDGSIDASKGEGHLIVNQHLSAGAKLDIQFFGSVSVKGPIWPILDGDINLGDVVKGSAKVDLFAALELSVPKSDPIEIQPSFSISDDASAGIRFDLSNGLTFPASATSSHDAGCDILKFGEMCAKFKLGPRISLSFNIGDNLGVKGEIALDGYVKACLQPDTVTSSCITGDLKITGGVECSVSGGLQVNVLGLKFSFSGSLNISLLGPYDIADFKFIFKDTAPPVITTPQDIVQGTDPGQCSANVSVTPATATGCASVTVTAARADGKQLTDPFPKGVTLISWTATDDKGLSSTSQQRVTILDLEKPVLAACPANIVKSTDPGLCSAVVTFPTPTATDNCPGVTVSCSPSSGTAFPKGTTTVTCTATDASGNQSTCQFTVTVNDTEVPKITCPGNQIRITARPHDASVAVVYPTPAISDNCPGATVVCTPASGSAFPVGTTVVNCVVTDASGNTASCSFTVTVYDVSLQDPSTSDILKYNTFTGEYVFTHCATGYTATGTGTVRYVNGLWNITDFKADRRINASAFPTNTGTASLSILAAPGIWQAFQISDTNPQPGAPTCH